MKELKRELDSKKALSKEEEALREKRRKVSQSHVLLVLCFLLLF